MNKKRAGDIIVYISLSIYYVYVNLYLTITYKIFI